MVTPIEIGLLVVAVLAVVLGYKLLQNVKALVVNAIVGIVILILANFLGLGVQISLLAVLICAIAGVPGAVLVILLSVVGVAFTPGVVALSPAVVAPLL
ncbi:MAG: pro-sigmaK processing inhibitor BofA family protein [Haloarculaceae archaeon]